MKRSASLRRWHVPPSSSVVVLCLWACASCSTPSGQMGNGGGTSSTTSLGLTGRVLFSNASSELVSLELDSGAVQATALPIDIAPSFDGAEWVGFDVSRRYSDALDDVVFYTSSAQKKEAVGIPRSLHDSVLLSPDKSKFVARWAHEADGESYTSPIVTVFARNGDVIIRDAMATAVAWTPSGMVVVAESRKILSWSPATGKSTYLFDAPGEVIGIAASRGSQQLAFSVVALRDNENRVQNSHVWVANMDGSGQRQVTSNASEYWREEGPMWIGPDDRYLLVRSTPGGSLEGSFGCSELFLVPAATSQPVTLDRANPGASTVLSYSLNGLTHEGGCPASAAFWSP